METAARVVLGAFVAIVLVHYLNGGRAQAGRYLKYVFAGKERGAQPVPEKPLKPPKPSQGLNRDPQIGGPNSGTQDLGRPVR